MSCDFDQKHLAHILFQINKHGYQSVLFPEANRPETPAKAIILRHDLDQDLESALDIAILENGFGLKATYFVWLGSPFYNPFEPANAQIIREIIALGHTLGLHFDAKDQLTVDLADKLELEAHLLESYFSTTCQVFSWHRPTEPVWRLGLKVGRLFNAYAPEFSQEYHYVSDSRGIWRAGCVCRTIESEVYLRLHLLLHPLWWGRKLAASPQDRIKEYIKSKQKKIIANCRWHIEGLAD